MSLSRSVWALALVLCIAITANAMPVDVRQNSDPSFVELSASSMINQESPLADIAELILEAKNRVGNLRSARNGVYVGTVEKVDTVVPLTKPEEKKKCENAGKGGTVAATLIPRLRKAKVVDPDRFGTHNPIESKNAVQAEVRDKQGKTILPFRDNIFPDPTKKAPADLDTPDLVKKLTAVELAKVNEIQRRLHTLLDNLGANIVFDYTPIKNRRITAEFLNIRKETKQLLDEYELRTGQRTIAWTLVEPDGKGLQEPHASIPDILNPNLPNIPIQRGLAGRPFPPPPVIPPLPKPEPLRRPREMRVNLRSRTFKDGSVKVIVETDTVRSGTKSTPPGASINFKLRSKLQSEEIVAAPFPLAEDLAETVAQQAK